MDKHDWKKDDGRLEEDNEYVLGYNDKGPNKVLHASAHTLAQRKSHISYFSHIKCLNSLFYFINSKWNLIACIYADTTIAVAKAITSKMFTKP